jgi:hypothetical protein
MVGGLADWFAVTALFRHPLHLPIPHTAIIPRNKDRIASTLAQFLRDNFLTPKVVARRMQRLDVAGAAGRWLANPVHGAAGLAAAPRVWRQICSNHSIRSGWAAWPRVRSPRGCARSTLPRCSARRSVPQSPSNATCRCSTA